MCDQRSSCHIRRADIVICRGSFAAEKYIINCLQRWPSLRRYLSSSHRLEAGQKVGIVGMGHVGERHAIRHPVEHVCERHAMEHVHR